MTIETLLDDTKSYHNLGDTYRTVEMRCGRHHAIVVVVAGRHPHITVYVRNAAAKAWGSNGKDFTDCAAAVANYKTAEIRAMIAHACEVVQVPHATSDREYRLTFPLRELGNAIALCGWKLVNSLERTPRIADELERLEALPFLPIPDGREWFSRFAVVVA